MLGNVNFGAVNFSASQIKKYDKDGDGKLSAQEQADAQKEINEQSKGAKDTAFELPLDYTYGVMISKYSEPEQGEAQDVVLKTPAEARKSFNTMKESFIENYIKEIQENSDLAANEKKSLIAFLNSKSAAFIDQYLKKNAEGPYNMDEITSAYQENIQQLLAQREEKNAAMQEKLSAYKQNADESFEKLAVLTQDSDSDYITDDEYSKIKEQAINYIMGQMLNGEDNSAFLSAINPNYKNSQNYKIALSCANAIQNETDPDKIEAYMKRAEQYLGEFLGNKDADGTSVLTNAVQAKNKETVKQNASVEIDKTVDNMVEDFSNETVTKERKRFFGKKVIKYELPAHSSEDVQTYQQKLGNIKTAFLAQYDGDGTDIEQAFKAFAQKALDEAKEVEAQIKTLKENFDETYNSLKDASQNYGSYASGEEKEKIDSNAVDYIINSIVSGQTDDELLAQMCPDYKTNGKYVLAKQLLNNLSVSAAPKEDYEKAQSLLKEMMSEISADTVKKAVKTQESKNVFLSISEMTDGLWGYGTKETVGDDNLVYTNFTINNGVVEWTNGDDKGDINKMYSQLRDRIHNKMKEQLGDNYNEADIDAYFNQAVNNVAMGLDNPAGLHTIEELADKTVAHFNNIATASLHGRSLDEGKAKLDMQTIVNNAGKMDNYCEKLGWSFMGNRLKIVVMIMSIRNQVLETMKAQLGSNYDEVEIDRMFVEASKAAVNQFNGYDNRNKTGSDVYRYYFEHLNNSYEFYLLKKGFEVNA